MLSLFELLAVLLTITATFAWLNQRVLRLPSGIGLLVMGLSASLVLIGLDFAFPGISIHQTLLATLEQIDFYDAVMNGMLAFLLFAGALHIDLLKLRDRALVVAILATVSVAISTLIIATGIWWAASLLAIPLDFAWALVFGALIAPTDPVAVLSLLKTVTMPRSLKIDMPAEALFNDGVAVVIFGLTLGAALGNGGSGVGNVLELIAIEAGGGAILGLGAGLIAYYALRSIDDYSNEVLITLALVMGTYALASHLHTSGPIAVVVAGLVIGNQGAWYAMSDTTKRFVFGFWTLVDDILNSILFLLIGLEVLILHFDPHYAWLGLVAIPVVLVARLVSVAVPVGVLGRWKPFARGTIPVLTWGGVRGGISIALALSLPAVAARPVILVAAYAVVLFSIIVQGLSLGWVVRRTVGPEPADEADASGDAPGF